MQVFVSKFQETKNAVQTCKHDSMSELERVNKARGLTCMDTISFCHEVLSSHSHHIQRTDSCGKST